MKILPSNFFMEKEFPPTPVPATSPTMSTETARAIRFIYTDEEGKFRMEPEAVGMLQLVKQPVGVVSVCGRARQGKSFILNQLLGRSSGFQVASTHRPCTKGLWLWSIPIKRTADGTDYNLLLLDSEGIDAFDQTETYSTQIFSLAVLLSSMFIYNQMGGIDEAALDRLSLVTEMTKRIRVRASGSSTALELGQFSPIFVWLLRDFYLDLMEEDKKITPRDYLEIALKPGERRGRDVAAKNAIRESIRALFPDRECFPLVRPIVNEEDLQRLDQIPLEKLRPEFRSGLDSLTRFVFERTRPKQMGATVMTGPIFARFTQSFLDAFNNGAVPTITSTWQCVEEAECQRAYDQSTEVYMSSFDRSGPPEEAALREAHEDAVRQSMATFNDTAVGAEQIRHKYEERLRAFLRKAFEDIRKDAFQEAYLHCTRTIENMDSELRTACDAPDVEMDTILKVLDGLLSKYEASCQGPEKWRTVVNFLQQSLEGPLLDFIKRQIDQIGEEKSSLALKCGSMEDEIELLNQQLEASEKRYQDAIVDKENLSDDYMSRINNLVNDYSSLEEKSSNLKKVLDTARQECADWKRKHESILLKQKAEEEQFGAEVAMLRSRSSAAEARLAAAQEEAEEWKRKYNLVSSKQIAQEGEFGAEVGRLRSRISAAESRLAAAQGKARYAQEEAEDWKRLYKSVLSKQKAEEVQFGAETEKLRSKCSAAEARLAAAQGKAESARKEAEEWKRKYELVLSKQKGNEEKSHGKGKEKAQAFSEFLMGIY